MNKIKIEQFYTKWQTTLPQRIEGYISMKIGVYSLKTFLTEQRVTEMF